MPTADQPNIIAHVDADCFYASCERIRHPELKGRPICVLSSQDAFVVAKTYDAKARGVTTGMSVWEAKRRVPAAAFLTPDFRYYGQQSARMFAILSRYSPQVEVYSIDEAFMEMGGVRALWRGDLRRAADDIRDAVRREVGITVSVGIASTRTLAKIASESRKPDGTTVLSGRDLPRFLAGVRISDIPGIGERRAALLERHAIRTALAFVRTEEERVGRLMGKLGIELWRELRGHSVYGLETGARLPKSLARTASMGQVTTDGALIEAHLSHHTQRLVSDMVAKGILARRIRVFLTLDSFERVATEIRVNEATSSMKRLSAAVRGAFGELYREGEKYRACGVVATHIVPEGSVTPDLFGDMGDDSKQRDLVRVMNEINRRYGNHSLTTAQASQLGKHRKDEVRFRYPLLKAR